MSNHIIQDLITYLSNGPEKSPGESLQGFRSQLKAFAAQIEDKVMCEYVHIHPGKMGSETVLSSFIAPYKCEIVEIRPVKQAHSGACTVAFEKRDASADTTANVLTATNFDLTTLTNNEPGAALTLSATEANYQFDKGDSMKITWVAGTSFEGGLIIKVKPIN